MIILGSERVNTELVLEPFRQILLFSFLRCRMLSFADGGSPCKKNAVNCCAFALGETARGEAHSMQDLEFGARNGADL